MQYAAAASNNSRAGGSGNIGRQGRVSEHLELILI